VRSEMGSELLFRTVRTTEKITSTSSFVRLCAAFALRLSSLSQEMRVIDATATRRFALAMVSWPQETAHFLRGPGVSGSRP
jgi:hypothetical protein